MLDWELTVADTRIHGTARRQVGKHFVEVERGAGYRCRWSRSRRITNRAAQCTATVTSRSRGAYYAVPPEYLAREVWVRWDARMVRIFNERMEPIVVHTRQEPGRFSTPPELIASEKISGVKQVRHVALGQGEEPAGST